VAGLKFRRQQPLSQYIVDFVCAENKLIIEVDGSSHAEQADYDAARTAYLAARGFRVIRFTNAQILNELDAVLTAICQAASPNQP
jgi:very-short-patch-repair endonuclease